MPQTVWARSLSSLNEIADSPPSNPPLQLEGEDPLVLYIARVPGCRDVFLTTMKPRDKVVSAQDVESSLYYCHLSSDQDLELLEEGNDVGLINDASLDSHDTSQSRSHQKYADQDRTDTPLAVHRSSEQKQSMLKPPTTSESQAKAERHQHSIGRKPIKQRLPLTEIPLDQESDIKPRLLGPRPIPRKDGDSIATYSVPLASKSDLTVPPPLPDRRPRITASNVQPLLQIVSQIPSNRRFESSQRQITLIRRDPGTSDQWNVGTLSLGQIRQPNSPSKSPKRTGRNVEINIVTPGYMKFSSGSSQSSNNFTSALDLNSTVSADSDVWSSMSTQSYTFTTPWHTKCVFNTAASGRALKCYNMLPPSLLSPSAQAMSSGRSPSMIVSELRFNLPSFGEKKVAKKKENRRPLSQSAYNLSRNGILVNLLDVGRDSSDRGLSMKPRLPPRPTSYQGLPLRQPAFGLGPGDGATNNHTMLTYRSLQAQQSDDEEEDQLETELDLSLGQERAGGGFSGNKAKLGKLIIYGGQGLAMLDLLVAANMGVWFKDVLND